LLNLQFFKKNWHWNVELAVVLLEKMHWVPIRLKNGSRSLGQRCILLSIFWPSILQKFYMFPRKVPKFPTKWANRETWKIQLALGLKKNLGARSFEIVGPRFFWKRESTPDYQWNIPWEKGYDKCYGPFVRRLANMGCQGCTCSWKLGHYEPVALLWELCKATIVGQVPAIHCKVTTVDW